LPSKCLWFRPGEQVHDVIAPDFSKSLGPHSSIQRGELSMVSTVTAVVTHYRQPELLGVAVHSLLDQTYPDLIVYVIDDCTPDSEWIKRNKDLFASSRVRLFRSSRNVGTYQLKNKILQQITSPLVMFQDADDYSRSDRLAKQLEAMVRHGADLVGCRFAESAEDEFDPARFERREFPSVNMPASLTLRYMLGKKWLSLHPSWLVKTALLKRVNYFNGRFRVGSDDLFLYHCILNGKAINCREQLYYKRSCGGSLTNARSTGVDSEYRKAVRNEIEAFRRSRFRHFLSWDRPSNEVLFVDDFDLAPVIRTDCGEAPAAGKLNRPGVPGSH
jgi:glycosyltransferase involved in cell wall biosynthesis